MCSTSSHATPRLLRILLSAFVGLAWLLLIGSSLGRLGFLLQPPAPSAASLSGETSTPSSAALTNAAFVAHSSLAFGHIGPGLLLVLLGPLQFSRRLRARMPVAHRWLGRVFMLASVATAGAGLVMNFTFPPSGGWLQIAVLCGAAFGQVATVWMGWRAIRARDLQGHRIWMTRAWGIALAGGTTGLVAVPLYLLQGELSQGFIGVSRLVGLIVAVSIAEVYAQRRLDGPSGATVTP